MISFTHQWATAILSATFVYLISFSVSNQLFREHYKIESGGNKMTSNDSGSVSHLTLEEHFKNLSVKSEDSGKLYSIWVLLKGDLEERLRHTQNIYVTFSLHDSSHSRSILRSIERFLGVARIAQLSLLLYLKYSTAALNMPILN